MTGGRIQPLGNHDRSCQLEGRYKFRCVDQHQLFPSCAYTTFSPRFPSIHPYLVLQRVTRFLNRQLGKPSSSPRNLPCLTHQQPIDIPLLCRPRKLQPVHPKSQPKRVRDTYFARVFLLTLPLFHHSKIVCWWRQEKEIDPFQ